VTISSLKKRATPCYASAHGSVLLCILSVILAILSITAPVDAEGAEFLLLPAIALSEEYNDNIFLAPDNRTAEYITHIIPGIQAEYVSPNWDWQLTYAYDRRYFAKSSFPDDSVQQVNLRSTTRIVQDLLYFGLRDDAGRISISSIQNYAAQGPIQNQTNFNVLDMGPYAVLQLTSRTTLTTGYLYRDVRYSDPLAIDRTVRSPYSNLSWILTPKTALNASVRYDRIETVLGTKTRMISLYGFQYDYQDGSFLWGRIGPSRLTYGNKNSETLLVWDAGFTHRITQTMTLNGETGRAWIEDPYLVEWREDRILAALRSQKGRTTAGLSIAMRNYGTLKYYTDASRYTATADFGHFLTELLQAKYAVSINRYDRYPANAPDTMAIVWQTDVSLDYLATQKLTLSLVDQYTDSYSVNSYIDNYEVNSVLIQAKMRF